MGLNIKEFYAGKTVFLTGTTGFVGKVVLEKMLRTLPMIKKIFIMVVKMIINNDHDNHVFEYLTITDHEFSDDFYDNLTAGSELDFYVDLACLG